MGIALELPRSSRPKTGGGAKRVFHELHVLHPVALQPEEDGKWRCHRLAHFGRGIGESPKDRYLIAFSKNVLWRK